MIERSVHGNHVQAFICIYSQVVVYEKKSPRCSPMPFPLVRFHGGSPVTSPRLAPRPSPACTPGDSALRGRSAAAARPSRRTRRSGAGRRRPRRCSGTPARRACTREKQQRRKPNTESCSFFCCGDRLRVLLEGRGGAPGHEERHRGLPRSLSLPLFSAGLVSLLFIFERAP